MSARGANSHCSAAFISLLREILAGAGGPELRRYHLASRTHVHLHAHLDRSVDRVAARSWGCRGSPGALLAPLAAVDFRAGAAGVLGCTGPVYPGPAEGLLSTFAGARCLGIGRRRVIPARMHEREYNHNCNHHAARARCIGLRLTSEGPLRFAASYSAAGAATALTIRAACGWLAGHVPRQAGVVACTCCTEIAAWDPVASSPGRCRDTVRECFRASCFSGRAARSVLHSG